MALLVLLVSPGESSAAQSEVDALMERVLQHRDENRLRRQDYVLDERETFELVGPSDTRLQRFDREYSWYVRDGLLVRSPVRFDGVAIREGERRSYEEEWLRQEQRRAENSGRRSTRRRRSTGGTLDDILITVEREWGQRVSEQLGRQLAEDARLWYDDTAAIVAGTDRITTDLGGVEAVGFGTVAARTRDAFVMLDAGRLTREQVTSLMTVMVPTLVDALHEASDAEAEQLAGLAELAAGAGLGVPKMVASLEEAEAILASRGASELADRIAVAREAMTDTGPVPGASDEDGGVGPDGVPRLQPRFVSEAFFFDFEFEPGNYYYVGRDTVDGRDVVKIEYYPEQLFSDADANLSTGSRDDRIDTRSGASAAIEAGFDKTSLVTLWIDPQEDQIVRFAFDNVGFDFLPMRWMARLDDLTMSMVMGQPFEGVWLPETVEVNGRLVLATGDFRVAYSRVFSNYRQPDVRVRIRSYDTPPE
jgi:hypothetical protein